MRGKRPLGFLGRLTACARRGPGAAVCARPRFTHLISVDFFNDLLAVLKTLAHAHVLDTQGSLQCVLTTLQLASGQGTSSAPDPCVHVPPLTSARERPRRVDPHGGTRAIPGEALNLDLKDFGILLYGLVLDLFADGGQHVPVALAAIEAMLLKRRQLSDVRVAAFAKRLATVLLYLPSEGVLAALATVHMLLQVSSR